MDVSIAFLAALFGFVIAIPIAMIDANFILRHIKLSKAYHRIKFFVLLLAWLYNAIYFQRFGNSFFANAEIIVGYWMGFDLMLNWFRGKSAFYYNPSGESAIDRFAGKLKLFGPRLFAVKFILFVAFGALHHIITGT